MDVIYLKDLRVGTVIGIYEWEKCIKQTISIDLEMGADIRKAALTDTIDDTLNYKAVSKRVITFVESNQFQLIETLAEKIAELLLKEFKLPWLKITVSKPGAIRAASDVGVIIERGSRN